MPLTYWINRFPNAVFIRYNRSPRFEEWAAAMTTILHLRDYSNGSDFLFDRGAIDEPPDTEYIHQKVRFIQEHDAQFFNGRWAIVVKNQVSYGMERMAQGLSEGTGVDLRAFTNMREAEQWLMSAKDLG